jgi:ATP-binding cassette subfamily B protein
MAGVIAETALRALEPWPLKVVFDAGLGVRHRLDWPWLHGLSPDLIVGGAAAAVLLITAARACLGYVGTISGALVGNRVVSQLRDEMYTHLQRLPLTFHARARAGDLTVRLVGDIGVMRDVAVTALLPLITNLLILVSMAGVMLWFNWRLALVALALLPLVALSTHRLTGRIQHTAREQRRHEGELAARAGIDCGRRVGAVLEQSSPAHSRAATGRRVFAETSRRVSGGPPTCRGDRDRSDAGSVHGW